MATPTLTVPHNTIVNTPNPKGVFVEGIINDTSKPGTLMQIDTTVTMAGNRFGYKALAVGTDGKDALILVLIEDALQGKLVSDAYVSGTQCRMYAPARGETTLARLGEVAGTGNTYAVGDRLIVDAEDGLLVPESGSPQATVAQVEDVLTTVAGGSLCNVRWF